LKGPGRTQGTKSVITSVWIYFPGRRSAARPPPTLANATTAKMGTLFHRNYSSTPSDPQLRDIELTPSDSPAKPAATHPAQEKNAILPTHQVNHNGHKVTKHIAPEVRPAPPPQAIRQSLTCARGKVAGKEYTPFTSSGSAGVRPAMPHEQSTSYGPRCQPQSPFDMLEKTFTWRFSYSTTLQWCHVPI